MAIYKMDLDCGRMGSLEGVFVEDIEKVNKLISSSREVYFGEVLGKHSEIVGSLDKEDLKMVTDDPKIVDLFIKFDLSSGYNPFDYLEENWEEEEE